MAILAIATLAYLQGYSDRGSGSLIGFIQSAIAEGKGKADGLADG